MPDRKLIACWLLVFVVPAVSGAADGAAKEVRVKIDGLACPFCAYNVEKRIRTLDGYRDDTYEAFVDMGLVTFGWKASVPFEKAAVREQVRKSGFKARKIEIADADEDADASTDKVRLRGVVTVREGEDGPVVRLNREDGEPVTLRAAERIDRRESFDRLKDFGKEGDEPAVVIRGRPSKEGEVTLHGWAPQTHASEVLLKVKQLACERCSTGVMRALSSVDGLIHAEADHQENQVRVWSNAKNPDMDAMRQAIEEAGFEVTHAHQLPREDAKGAEKK